MIWGFDWSWGLGFCEALLCWVVVAAAAVGRAYGRFWTEDPPPFSACWPEPWVPIALCSVRSTRWLDDHCRAIVLCVLLVDLCA